LDAIDQLAVHQCGYCSRPLSEDSESLDYCSDAHQAAWLAERHEVAELIGYREPYDLPVHQSNLVELHSAETTPTRPDGGYGFEFVGQCPCCVTVQVTVDTSRFEAAMGRLVASVQRLREAIPDGDRTFARLSSGWVSFPARRNGRSRRGVTAGHPIVDELGPIGVVINSLRVAAPEPELVLEVPDEPPFGSDFDFEHRPAASLPDEPPPAVMPDLPARDWQALVDAHVSHTGPVRVSRAPRHLGRTT
jgi:hypothetical protein